MIIGSKSDVFHPWKERIHNFQFEIRRGMHACHILSYCPNERLQSWIIFSFLVAFSPFMSHLVTQLELPAKYTHNMEEETQLGGKNSLAQKPTARWCLELNLCCFWAIAFCLLRWDSLTNGETWRSLCTPLFQNHDLDIIKCPKHPDLSNRAESVAY